MEPQEAGLPASEDKLMASQEAALPTAEAKRSVGLNWSRFYIILILVIFLGTAFDNMDQATCSFILSMMRMEWGLTALQTSYMPGAALFGTAVGAVFWGMMADRLGRRNALIYTVLIFSITSLIQTHSWSYPQFCITCFFMGFGVGGEIPLAFTFLNEYLPARVRTRAALVIGILAIVIGYAFAALNAHFLLPTLGWKSLFYFQAVPALLVVVIRFKLPESARYLRSIGREVQAQQIAADVLRQTGDYDPLSDSVPGLIAERPYTPIFEGLRQIWQNIYKRRTVANWIFGFCVGFFEFGFIIWLPTFLRNQGYSDAQAVNYPLLINFFAIPSALAVLYLLRVGGSKLILTLYPLVAGIATIILGMFLTDVAGRPVLLVLLGGVIFFFGTTLLGIFPPYSAEVYPTEVRGTGAGWAAGFTRFGSFLGPLAGGLMFELLIPAQDQLMFFGAFLVVGAVVMFFLGVQTYKQTLEEISPSLALAPASTGGHALGDD